MRRGGQSRRRIGAVLAVLACGVTLAVPAVVHGQAAPAQPGGVGRRALEQRIRERFAHVVQTRLALTDAQMAQLRATNQRFGGRRRALSVSERGVRQSLQGELRPGVAANQAHVSALMDSLLAIQRERLDLVQEEQRELAGYLTPVQRVRYYALQQALRKRLDQLQQVVAAHPPLFKRGQGGGGANAMADSLEAAPF
jgi:hypothetical protein